MAKKLLQSYLPDPDKLQNNRWLKLFGRAILEPNLWHLHRRSVAKAFSIGLFITYIPLPGHMLVAAFLAILLRANLPIALTLVWVVNPLTMIPMFGFAYAIGAYLLGMPILSLQLDWQGLKDIWQPLMLGSLICGSFLSIVGNIGIRAYWRYSVSKAWKNRHARRQEASALLS